MTDRPTDACDAEYAGYDGMFGVYCDLPKGHAGSHRDGHIEWRLAPTDRPSHDCATEAIQYNWRGRICGVCGKKVS